MRYLLPMSDNQVGRKHVIYEQNIKGFRYRGLRTSKSSLTVSRNIFFGFPKGSCSVCVCMYGFHKTDYLYDPFLERTVFTLVPCSGFRNIGFLLVSKDRVLCG